MISTTDKLRQAIDQRRFSEPMKSALKALLDGDSYRTAAEKAGVEYRQVHRNAGTVAGLREAHLLAWRDDWEKYGGLPEMWRQHLKRLEEAA